MSVDYQMMLTKYAAAQNAEFVAPVKKEKKLSDPAKRALAGALAGVAGIPILQPIDVIHTRKMTDKPLPSFKGSKLKAIKELYAGSGVRAIKTGLATSLMFASFPYFKKKLDKYV